MLVFLEQAMVQMLDPEVRMATKYVGPNQVTRVTRIHCKGYGRRPPKNHDIELRVHIGRPNFADRKFIKDCKKVGLTFPIAKVQLKHFPAKKRK